MSLVTDNANCKSIIQKVKFVYKKSPPIELKKIAELISKLFTFVQCLIDNEVIIVSFKYIH